MTSTVCLTADADIPCLRGAYHLLCLEFRELIDFYRMYEKTGKEGIDHTGRSTQYCIFFYIRYSNRVPSVWMQ